MDGAKKLFNSRINVISTSYILCMDDRKTSVAKKVPINFIKDFKDFQKYIYFSEISNFSVIYLEGGSGSKKPVSTKFVKEARKILTKPLIVGGGIKSADIAYRILESGADFIVTGNSIENDPDNIFKFSEIVQIFNK